MGGDALPLVTAPSGRTATGRHGAVCDRRNRQPQNGEAEPRGVGAPLPPAPHCLGRVRGAPAHPEPHRESGPWGTSEPASSSGPCRAQYSSSGRCQPLPQPRPQGWQLGVTGVPTGTPHSTAIPEHSPCPTNAACGRRRRASTAATCSPAAGGGGWLQEGAIRKSKEKPGWRSRCGRTFPAGKLLGRALPGCPCSWRSRQRGTARCRVEEHRAGASPTRPTPTGVGCRCPRPRFGWLLKADFPQHPFPATLPCLLPATPAASPTAAGWARWEPAPPAKASQPRADPARAPGSRLK